MQLSQERGDSVPIASRYRRRIFRGPLEKHSLIFQGPSACSSDRTLSISVFFATTLWSSGCTSAPLSCAKISRASSCLLSLYKLVKIIVSSSAMHRMILTLGQPTWRLWENQYHEDLGDDEDELAGNRSSPYNRTARVVHSNVEVACDDNSECDEATLGSDHAASGLGGTELTNPKRGGGRVEAISPTTKSHRVSFFCKYYVKFQSIPTRQHDRQASAEHQKMLPARLRQLP